MKRKNRAFESLTDLRAGSERVLLAAKAAVASPEDHASQLSLASAQKELGAGVRKVFEAVCTDAEEVQLSLRAVDSALNDDGKTGMMADKVFHAAREALDEIAKFPTDGHSSEVQEILIRGREVCGKSSNLVAQIRALAKETKVQDLKNSLGTAAKLLNDRAIRIKIISIVKLASGEGNDDVAMAVAGLKSEIYNIVDSLRAELLRLKLATATNQVTAMKTALGVLRTHSVKA